ncbi:hypothetical protein KP509_30G014400 [Ceratopteris richardii]|nr:hypothetical protein KP509_30G014400 [Ceratopteris richardii]
MEHLEKAAQREICELRLITSKDDIAQRTSWWEQFVILLVRGMKERRHEYWSALRIIQVVFSAFLSGCLWWRPKQFNPQPQDQLGLLFFIAVFWCYLSLFTAIFTFPLERAILARERASDMYQLSAFFMARTSGDLPFDLGLAIMFMVILYFMTTLKQSFYAFTLTLLTTFLTVITSQGFGLFIGASMMDVQKATTLASILILILMLAGGFFIKNIPSFMSWIKYFSLQAHTFNILIHIQHSNYTITLVPNDPNSPNAVVDTLQGTPFYPAGNSIMALFALAFTYRVLTYISLRCMRY